MPGTSHSHPESPNVAVSNPAQDLFTHRDIPRRPG
jgi:hypothetical protein